MIVVQGPGVQDPSWACGPPHRHRVCMPGAAQGSQPSVTLEGGGGHGELIAVFLLDMCLKVPVGRNELRQGSVGEKHNSSVVRSPLTNPYGLLV